MRSLGHLNVLDNRLSSKRKLVLKRNCSRMKILNTLFRIGKNSQADYNARMSVDFADSELQSG